MALLYCAQGDFKLWYITNALGRYGLQHQLHSSLGVRAPYRASNPRDQSPPMTTPQPSPAPASDPRKDSLIEYPSRFPIKVMGLKVDGLVHAITELAHRFDPDFDATSIELRESSAGKYLGVTITITATSREQLDDLYRALSGHPMVKVVL